MREIGEEEEQGEGEEGEKKERREEEENACNQWLSPENAPSQLVRNVLETRALINNVRTTTGSYLSLLYPLQSRYTCTYSRALHVYRRLITRCRAHNMMPHACYDMKGLLAVAAGAACTSLAMQLERKDQPALQQ